MKRMTDCTKTPLGKPVVIHGVTMPNMDFSADRCESCKEDCSGKRWAENHKIADEILVSNIQRMVR